MTTPNTASLVQQVAQVVYKKGLPSLLEHIASEDSSPLDIDLYRGMWELFTKHHVDGQAENEEELELDALLITAVGEYAVSRYEQDIPEQYRDTLALTRVYRNDTIDELVENIKDAYTKFYADNVHLLIAAAKTMPALGMPLLTVDKYVRMWEVFATSRVTCDPAIAKTVFMTGLKLHAFRNFKEDIPSDYRA